MLMSRWRITERRHKSRLVLEIPSRVPGKALVEWAIFQALWPIGVGVVPLYLARWVTSGILLAPLIAVVVSVCMVPWFINWLMAVYWLWGMERVTIRPGAVEIERGVGRWLRRSAHAGIKDSTWRVSPRRHHEYDARSRLSLFGLYGPGDTGGALTFSHGRRAVRCGRNFGTRKARVLLRDVREFLGQPNEGEPPKRRPKWLIVADGGTRDR